MEFKKIQLKELIEFANTGADAIQRAPIVEYDTGIKCIRIGDISNDRKYDEWGFTEITEVNINKYKLDIGDILIARTGSTIGISKIIKNEVNSVYNNGLIKVRVNKEKCDSYYFYYILQSKEFIDYIQGIAFGTTGQPNMKINDFLKFKTNDIPIDKQNKIVKILAKIDEKIDINNQINDNLFKFAINYLNNKKEDIEVPVSKFDKIQGGYAFKSKDLIDNKTENRVIKIKNLRSELNADVTNSQFVEDEVANNIDSKFKLNKGDVTIAMTGAELGKTGFLYGFDKYYLNQRVGVIRGKNKEGDFYLKLLFLSDEFQTMLNSKGYGSAQPNISTSDIENIVVNDLTEENLKDIYERLNAIYYRIISNCEENLNLEQLRDTLLPKLMNGEINLDKIEI